KVYRKTRSNLHEILMHNLFLTHNRKTQFFSQKRLQQIWRRQMANK
ncbi:hypothetical protein DOY81_006608, partial [Sarcophaga bullata]